MKTSKPKRAWPPSLSEVESLRTKAEAYDRKVSAEMQQPFVEAFVRNMGVYAAATPYEDWSPMMQVCAKHAAEQHPSSWEEYRQKLPKKPCPHCGGSHPVGCCAQDGHGG